MTHSIKVGRCLSGGCAFSGTPGAFLGTLLVALLGILVFDVFYAPF